MTRHAPIRHARAPLSAVVLAIVLPIVLVIVLAIVSTVVTLAGSRAVVLAEDRSDAPELPAGVREAYDELSRSILAEDMRAFMDLFHLDFIYEGTDGAALDRGPWRRLWLKHFDLRQYDRMTFSPEEVLETEEDRVVVRVRRVAVISFRADRPRQLEETIFEDTWIRDGAAWQLRLRTESEVRCRGTIPPAEEPISSPRVAALAESVRRDGEDREDEKAAAAIVAFWKDVRSAGAPIIESIPDDPAHHLVTFVWRGEGRETSVRLRGGRPNDERSKPLARLRDTDLWYRSERLPSDARFTYEFELSTAVALPATSREAGKHETEILTVESTSTDPLNERSVDGVSLAELPVAAAIPWTTAVADRPRGEVNRQTRSSEVLDERRFVSVYTPPGYAALESPCSAVFLLDSGSYSSRRATGTVLDNLIAEKKIPSTVVFMVHDEGSRRSELESSNEFVRFLGEELVEWARENYRIRREPEHCIFGGNGLGAALAAATALRHPDRFGSVLASDGTFAVCIEAPDANSDAAVESHCVPHRIATGKKLPLRFFVSLGALEVSSVTASNRHLRDVLEARGYDTTFRTVAANHNAITWQETLARGLMGLLSGR